MMSHESERWKEAVRQAETTGASAATAAQDDLNPGVEASRMMADTDWRRIERILDRFEAAALESGMPVALLAAIASRESRAGAALRHGWGDRARAFGIMQVDARYHVLTGLDDPEGIKHITQAANILAGNLRDMQRAHPDWEDAYLIKGAACAYNAGPGNVRTRAGMDSGTTGNDYGSDVMARAQFYLERIDR